MCNFKIGDKVAFRYIDTPRFYIGIKYIWANRYCIDTEQYEIVDVIADDIEIRGLFYHVAGHEFATQLTVNAKQFVKISNETPKGSHLPLRGQYLASRYLPKGFRVCLVSTEYSERVLLAIKEPEHSVEVYGKVRFILKPKK